MLSQELLARPLFSELSEVSAYHTAEEAVARIHEIYTQSTQDIRQAFSHLLEQGTPSSTTMTQNLERACYPFVGIRVDHTELNLDPRYSYGVVIDPGVYGGTVTRPDIFGAYYQEQIQLLLERHKVPVYVGISRWPIPLPFALDPSMTHTPSRTFDMGQIWNSSAEFVLPNLTRIDDEVANCTHLLKDQCKPISIFSGERVDYSLHRLHHYTGTNPHHFQKFVLLTNYQRYIDTFVQYGFKTLQESDEYESLVLPGDQICKSPEDAQPLPHLPQMPAYHLKRPDGMGITFINIGVGPSNTKNITDHLAVLRPHCWIMLGHCAGLRSTQQLGDYILAHGYVREDHALDDDLPLWVPIPPIAEVQVALQEAATNISHKKGKELKISMRTGTVFTTDNRNWELRSKELYLRFEQSRAIAVDMESATVAANGFRFRVPYGTLLCVSDKPIHGEIKLRGMANQFYQERVDQHLKIGLEAIRILRQNGVDQLHSRKLRGFYEPPFR